MVPLQKLEQIHQRYEFLEAQMSAGISGEEIAKLSKEYSQLKTVVEKIEEYKSLLADLKEAEVMMSDPGSDIITSASFKSVSYTHLTLPTKA